MSVSWCWEETHWALSPSAWPLNRIYNTGVRDKTAGTVFTKPELGLVLTVLLFALFSVGAVGESVTMALKGGEPTAKLWEKKKKRKMTQVPFPECTVLVEVRVKNGDEGVHLLGRLECVFNQAEFLTGLRN